MCQMEVIIRLKQADGQTVRETTLTTHPFDLLDVEAIPRAERLDRVEDAILQQGWQMMRQRFLKPWEVFEQQEPQRRRRPETGSPLQLDGKASLKVVSRLGLLELPRQVCVDAQTGSHVIPLNDLLPPHEGSLTTRGLQEWACLLSAELPFRTVRRLLGWMTHEAPVMSHVQGRQFVQKHGEAIRQAEGEDMQQLLTRPEGAEPRPHLLPADPPRRRPDWPKELSAAVEQVLADPEGTPPEGVPKADGERVLTYQRERAAERGEADADLSRWGPGVREQPVVAAMDGVVVRRPQRRRWWELRTARVATAQGYRYLSGRGEVFVSQLGLLLMLCRPGGCTSLTLRGDGARWIRDLFASLRGWGQPELILDWYHPKHKGYELSSLICRGRKAKAELLGPWLLELWGGQREAALARLGAYREQAKKEEALDELMGYLEKNRGAIPNYRERRARCEFIGSGWAEKANDLLVARRQKHQGMHWEEKTSDGLCALKTLMLNQFWDTYWQERRVPSLTAA